MELASDIAEGKNCSICGEFLCLSKYNKRKGVKDGRRSACKSCTSKKVKSTRYEPAMEGTTTCSKCKESKSVLLFGKQPIKKNGRNSHCKACEPKREKEILMEGEIRCSSCEKFLDCKNFYPNKGRANGRYKKCISCLNQERAKTSNPPAQEGKKNCKKCNCLKDVKDFYANKRSLDGREFYCKECQKRNPNKKIYSRRYSAKMREDPLYRISDSIRGRISRRIKDENYEGRKSFEEVIGCINTELRNHLEAQFKDGMSWENYGVDGWHVDHIIPLSSAKSLEELYKLNHYTNLQPLWAAENYSKGAKSPEEWERFKKWIHKQ